jgi:two-component system sensor histidine kinase and response regulator WspE
MSGAGDNGIQSMRDLLRQEGAAQLKILHSRLAALRTGKEIPGHLDALAQAAHSIMSGARLAAAISVEQLAGKLQSVFLGLRAKGIEPDGDEIAELVQAVDGLAALLESDDAEVPDDTLSALLERVGDAGEDMPPTEVEEAQSPPPAASEEAGGDTMRDLLRMEVETQAQVLTDNLLEVERGNATPRHLEALMRAAHSAKGGARIAGVEDAMRLAHAMEDLFVAAQKDEISLGSVHVDLLLHCVDTLNAIAHEQPHDDVDRLVDTVRGILAGEEPQIELPPRGGAEQATAIGPGGAAEAAPVVGEKDGVVRVSADSMNRLMGLSGELTMETRRVQGIRQNMLQTYRRARALRRSVDSLKERLASYRLDNEVRSQLLDLERQVIGLGERCASDMAAVEGYEHRTGNLAQRMYNEVVHHRMRPFGEGVQRFPRLVRDLCQTLGRKAELHIRGEKTPVDREIIERLNVPLTHLIQNALDHGIEPPEERRRAGKPETGLIRLSARHSSGRLSLVLEDDGRGIDLDGLRASIVERGLASSGMVEAMSEGELLDFLFLPKFSLKDEVSHISGRGVGLDVVHTMVQEVRGTIHISTRPGQGTRLELKLPITLSVVRSLLVDIDQETYAFPIARIERILQLSTEDIHRVENRDYFELAGQAVGLVDARQVLDLGGEGQRGDELHVVVIAGHGQIHGLVVDELLTETDLVATPLDPRLGKVPDVSAAAVLEDGGLALILDVDDLITSIEKIVTGQGLRHLDTGGGDDRAVRRKRVLVVDDSITVREVERNLLINQGYDVQVAVDGMDGWNALRMGNFDLLITDVDMPRMDGIELVNHVRGDARYKELPVMIVSYKDRDEDRMRGLEAGADYYLTKGSFHDETLVEAVASLIGEPE